MGKMSTSAKRGAIGWGWSIPLKRSAAWVRNLGALRIVTQAHAPRAGSISTDKSDRWMIMERRKVDL
jgi:hypothetical protein